MRDVTNYDVTTLIDTVHCKELILSDQKLNQEETEALVRAMATRVEIVRLFIMDNVRFDLETFGSYKGDGKCKEVHITIVAVGESGELVEYNLTNLLDSISCFIYPPFVRK